MSSTKVLVNLIETLLLALRTEGRHDEFLAGIKAGEQYLTPYTSPYMFYPYFFA